MESRWQRGHVPPNARSASLPRRPKACESICVILTGFVLQSMVVMYERLNSMLNTWEVKLPDA